MWNFVKLKQTNKKQTQWDEHKSNNKVIHIAKMVKLWSIIFKDSFLILKLFHHIEPYDSKRYLSVPICVPCFLQASLTDHIQIYTLSSPTPAQYVALNVSSEVYSHIWHPASGCESWTLPFSPRGGQRVSPVWSGCCWEWHFFNILFSRFYILLSLLPRSSS